MKCANCGREINEHSSFCGFCGTIVQPPGVENNDINKDNAVNNDNIQSTVYNNNDNTVNGWNDPAIQGSVSSPPPKPPVNIWLIILCAFAVLLIIGALLFKFLILDNSRAKKDAEINSTVSYTSTSAPVNTQAASTPSSTYRPAPHFTMATASSVRGTDSEGGQYSVMSVLTTDNETKWAPRKSGNGGIAEWVTIYSNETQYVSGIEILNGYHKSYEIWSNNNRVRGCTIMFSDGSSRSFILDDTMSVIKLDLGEVIETTYIKLRIDSIYRGIKWNDTAITYLGAY